MEAGQAQTEGILLPAVAPRSSDAYADEQAGTPAADGVGAAAAVGTSASSSGLNFDVRARRARAHESAHGAAAHLLGWTVGRISAVPGENASCEVSPPDTWPLMAGFQIEVQRSIIYLAADRWLDTIPPTAFTDYQIVDATPDADDVMVESGWCDSSPHGVGYIPDGTDFVRAQEFLRGVSSDGIAAGHLMNYAQNEARLLVRRPFFSVLVAALVEQLTRAPEMTGSMATSILLRAEARHEGVLP